MIIGFLLILFISILNPLFAWCYNTPQDSVLFGNSFVGDEISEKYLCLDANVDKHIQFYFKINFPSEDCQTYFYIPLKYPHLKPIKAWEGRSSNFMFLWYEGQGFLVDKDGFDALYRYYTILKNNRFYKESVNHEVFFYRLKDISNLNETITTSKNYFKFLKDNRIKEVLEFEGYLKNGDYILSPNLPKLNQSVREDEFVALCIFNREFFRLVKSWHERYKEAYVINGVIKPTTTNLSLNKVSVFINGIPTKELKCDDKCVFRHISLKDRYSVKISADCFSEFISTLKEQHPVIKLKPLGVLVTSEKQTIMTGERLWLKAVSDCKEINKYKFYWTTENKSLGSSSDKVEFIGNDIGNHNIVVKIMDEKGRLILEGKQTITVIDRLTIGINGPSELLINEEGLFSVYAKTGSLQSGLVKYSYSWTVDNKRHSSNENTIRLRFDTVGNHSIKLDFWQLIQRENRWQKIGEAIHYVNVKSPSSIPNQRRDDFYSF
ncbi:MAG: hypothetical protein N3A62_01085 [Thermodesulfovibrionales bacterium]|nr:hypothetical protein [Thermodesulfovibrionales bacterium]